MSRLLSRTHHFGSQNIVTDPRVEEELPSVRSRIIIILVRFTMQFSDVIGHISLVCLLQIGDILSTELHSVGCLLAAKRTDALLIFSINGMDSIVCSLRDPNVFTILGAIVFYRSGSLLETITQRNPNTAYASLRP